jgi:hypothetical protein
MMRSSSQITCSSYTHLGSCAASTKLGDGRCVVDLCRLVGTLQLDALLIVMLSDTLTQTRKLSSILYIRIHDACYALSP